MRFTKMHGAGNDYVYLDGFAQPVPAGLNELARAVSDRHTGIGADGLIVMQPSERADVRMRMFNADGSEAEMCGNGVRCVAKYVYDHGIAHKEDLLVETGRGILAVRVFAANGRADVVRVNMGPPVLKAADIPTTLPGDPPLNVELRAVSGEPDKTPLAASGSPLSALRSPLRVTCVSMGNPHCVVFVEELSDEWVLGLGPVLERHPAFPRRINVEFVQVLSPEAVIMRVWERGAGETLACGSGACAAVVAGALTGHTARSILAHLPGGDLHVEWSATGDVSLTGPAVEVFTGDWPHPTSAPRTPQDSNSRQPVSPLL